MSAVLFVIYIPSEDLEQNGDTILVEDNSKQANGQNELPDTNQLEYAHTKNTKLVSVPSDKSDQRDELDNIDESKPLIDHNMEILKAQSNLMSSGKSLIKSSSSGALMNTTKENSAILDGNKNSIKSSRFKVSAAQEDTNNSDTLNRQQRKTSIVADVLMSQHLEKNDMDITKEIITLSEFLASKLNYLNIHNDTWQKTKDQSQWQVNFLVHTSECDRVLNFLTLNGFGKIPGTTLSVFPTSVFQEGDEEDIDSEIPKPKLRDEKKEFLKSIKSSLTVAEVVGAISANAALTFDFILLILLASMIAGFGLAEDSSVVLVASMLISPLMGPIIGFTFGLVVKHNSLWRLSVRTEIIGLCICVGYGLIFGIITGVVDNTEVRWSPTGAWPTAEMQARGMLRSLWVGIFIALPSGAGVALAILGGNTGSLIGVAISASLLPPLVNAGMLWGFAIVSGINLPELDYSKFNYTIPEQVLYPPDCAPLLHNKYKFIYTCNLSTDSAILGSVSLLLAILNIICIFIMGCVVMKIKELSPLPESSSGRVKFWKKDVAVMREAYQTVKGPMSLDMARMAKDFLNTIKTQEPNTNVDNVIDDIRNDLSYSDIHSHLPQSCNLLNQISLENRVLRENVRKSLPYTEDITYGDKVYHTIGANHQTVRNFLNMSPAMPRFFLDGNENKDMESSDTAGGCVIRMRLPAKVGDFANSEVPTEELTVLDVEKLRRKSRHYSQAHRRSYATQRNTTLAGTPRKVAYIKDVAIKMSDHAEELDENLSTSYL